MARTTLNLNFQKMAYIDQENPDTHFTLDSNTWYDISYGTDTVPARDMLFGLEPMPSNLKHNKLYGIQFVIFVKKASGLTRYCVIYPNAGTFNNNTVTYNTQPTKVLYASVGARGLRDVTTDQDLYIPNSIGDSSSYGEDAKNAFYYGSLRISSSQSNPFQIRSVLSDGSTPYAIVTYDSATIVKSKISKVSGPSSGYFNPRTAAVFKWKYIKANSNEYCASPFWDQSAATFFWKSSEESSYHQITAGTNTTLTVPANTFPTASTIQWYVSGTDTDGTTSQTEVFSFSTAAGTAYAYAQSPIGSVEDGSAPIVFRWNLGSSDGQAPSRVRAWWKLPSEDNNSWHVLCDVNEAITSYTAAADTFQAGEVQWKVQAFNVDGTGGPWDANIPNAKTFVVVAAPNPVEGLNATAVPLSTISWQSGEQKAYEISIDGSVVRKAYSESVNTWTVPEPLPDGDHEISVRVQGQYGLWAQPSTVTITVANTTSRQLTLQGQFGLDAELSVVINGTGTFTRVHWYRDGVQFAQQNTSATTQINFTDRGVLGLHSYYAEVWFTNGNYVRSNIVSGRMSTSRLMIAPAAGGDWLDIWLSDQRENREIFSLSNSPALYHVLGAKYPHADLNPFVDFSGSYNCAFTDPEKAEQFEAMFASAVILKSRWDNVLTGILTPLRKTANRFYVSYTFTVQQVHTGKMVIVNAES